MGVLHRAVVALLATAMLTAAIENSTKEDDNSIYDGFDDYEVADDQQGEILFNEDKPCPRDCVCEKTQGYRIAKCNRLELGTQKFGDDITDLIVEHLDPTLELKLEDKMFKQLGLHQVATIKIVNTTITSISLTAFHGLHDLYAVTLTANRLTSLHPETFAHNRKLILLTLSENPLIFPAKGSNEYFLNSTTVQELDISNCNMRYIASKTFSELESLMYLNVAGNELASISSDVFRYLLDLEELDLSDNHIMNLADDLFTNNTELATLHIQRNPIESVYGLNIPDIVTLNAGQTKIKFVGPSMFNGLTYISNLNLSGNGIEKIHNQAFHKLQDLNYLDLSYNNLDFVSSLLIEQNNELDIFKISNNRMLKHLPKNGFNCSAEQFNVYLFDASDCGLEEISDNALRTFPALTQINLSGNQLQSIGDNLFAKCTRLVEVNLANNLLTTLNKKVFAHNKDLSKINLRGNPISVLSSQVFVFTPKLTWLDLSENELASLWEEKDKQPSSLLNNLLFLNISNNNIQEIKQYEIETITQLTTLDISNNPLICSRDFEMLMTWVTKYKISSTERDSLVSNLARDSPKVEDPYTWDALVKKTCDSSFNSTKYLTLTSSSESASDEEIWENVKAKNRIGRLKPKKIAEDLNPIFDDAKEVDDAKLDDNIFDDDTNIDDAKIDDTKIDYNYDAEEEDDDDYDEDMDIRVKLLDDQKRIVTKVSTTETTLREELEMEVKVLDEEETLAILGRTIHGKYDYIWPILIVVLAALLILVLIGKVVMIVGNRRSRQSRYNSAIIAAMQQGRTKKDCGLVYQQLSEDLVGPRTPKLSRYAPLPAPAVHASHILYETSPLRQGSAVPEAV